MEIINRLLKNKIVERLQPGKAVLLFGARRVGKTVLLKDILGSFPGRTMLLNGEDYDTLLLLKERSIANYSHLFWRS
jgi:predicted AAA+ superfamily ATPase